MTRHTELARRECRPDATAHWWAITSASALRALPAPTKPPQGTLDGVVGLLLSRAAPFDVETQSLLRRQHGWGTAAPHPIPDDKSHGRWMAVPVLSRLTRATAPPRSLVQALGVLERVVPCLAEHATDVLMDAGLTETPMHPGGVLRLADWYSVPTSLRLVFGSEPTVLVGKRDPAASRAMHQVMTGLSRAGFGSADGPPGLGDRAGREFDYLLTLNRRARRSGDLIVLADDRTSGLFLQVSRMLRFAPRPLTEDELYGGLTRHWRFRPKRLPARLTVSAWLDAQSWLRRADNAVSLGATLTLAETAKTDAGGTAELAAVVASGATASWPQLVAALTVKGVKPETAKMAAHTNPILVHVGPNQYRLRGT